MRNKRSYVFLPHLLHFLLSEKVLMDFLSRSVDRMNPSRLRRLNEGSPGTWGGFVCLTILAEKKYPK